MSERGDSAADTRPSAPEAGVTAPEVSQREGAQAVAEGAADAVDPAPATGVASPAPPLDESAATPDRPEPVAALAGMAEQRPELLVAGAFVGGLVLALLLKRVAGD